jgi:hypothetical protein
MALSTFQRHGERLCLDCVAVAPSVLLLPLVPLNSGLRFRVRATDGRHLHELVDVTLTLCTPFRLSFLPSLFDVRVLYSCFKTECSA